DDLAGAGKLALQPQAQPGHLTSGDTPDGGAVRPRSATAGALCQVAVAVAPSQSRDFDELSGECDLAHRLARVKHDGAGGRQHGLRMASRDSDRNRRRDQSELDLGPRAVVSGY